MRFKTFLTEAKESYTYSNYFADKIVKLMKDIRKNPKRYEKFRYPKDGTYRFSLANFLKLNDDEKLNGYVRHFKVTILNLTINDEYDGSPAIKLSVGKNVYGNNVDKIARGALSDGKELIIPFVNRDGEYLSDYEMEKIRSTIVHELTHRFQSKYSLGDGTAHLSSDEWFKNKKEQEAIKNQLYLDVKNYIKNRFRDFDYYKKDKMFKDAYKELDGIFLFFDTLDSFKKSIKLNKKYIFWVKSNLDRFDKIRDEYPDFYKEMIEEFYEELQKDFKNVIPKKKYDWQKLKGETFLD